MLFYEENKHFNIKMWHFSNKKRKEIYLAKNETISPCGINDLILRSDQKANVYFEYNISSK